MNINAIKGFKSEIASAMLVLKAQGGRIPAKEINQAAKNLGVDWIAKDNFIKTTRQMQESYKVSENVLGKESALKTLQATINDKARMIQDAELYTNKYKEYMPTGLAGIGIKGKY